MIDTNDVPNEPTTYTNAALSLLRVKALDALTTRKLNSEFLLIKNQILGANSTGAKHITHAYTYTYTYDPTNMVNDYFFQLLDKIQTMFPESTINYVINVQSVMELNVNLLYTKDTSSASNPDLTYNPITNLIKIDWSI